MAVSRFFSICGGRQPLRAELDGTPRTLASPIVRIGGDPRADLVIPGAASLDSIAALIDGNLFFIPVHDASRRQCEWVTPETILEVGETLLQFQNPVQSSWQPAWPLDRDDDLPPLAFDARGGFRSRKALEIGPRLMLIGTADVCKFKIAHAGIAPLHAVILRTPAGPWIVDATFDGGTRVNDAAVIAAPLRHGDRVSLGDVDLVARAAASTTAVASTPSPGVDTAVGPILAQVATFQQQTFDQFREMLGSMTEMFGAVLAEHRQFVREEFARLERVGGAPAQPAQAMPQLPAAPEKPAVPPPIAPFQGAPESIGKIPAPAPGASAPAANSDMHAWVQDQIGNLEKQQTSRWQKMLEKFRGY